MVYFELGQYERAVQDYDEAIEFQPQFADAYYNRGIEDEELGRYDRARRDFEKAEGFRYDP